MSTLLCRLCNKHSGNDGPTRDIKYIICTDCTVAVMLELEEAKRYLGWGLFPEQVADDE